MDFHTAACITTIMGRRNYRHGGNYNHDDGEDERDGYHKQQHRPRTPTGPRAFGQSSRGPNHNLQQGPTNPFTRPQNQHHNQDSRPYNQNQSRNQHHPRNQDHTPAAPSYQDYNHQVFHEKSKRVKRKLLQYLNDAFDELSRWNVTETLGVNEMDWQPEGEIVIPMIDPNTVYSYGARPPVPAPIDIQAPATAPVLAPGSPDGSASGSEGSGEGARGVEEARTTNVGFARECVRAENERQNAVPRTCGGLGVYGLSSGVLQGAEVGAGAGGNRFEALAGADPFAAGGGGCVC